MNLDIQSGFWPFNTLIDDSNSSGRIVSISELNRLARVILEREIPLMWVAGEVSNLTRAASGHVYFSLKDETAQARCVMFRSRAQLIPWQLTNGQQVEARALISLYEPRGDYQLNVESLRRAGLGRLYEAYARLQQKLELEGLFATERKRALPRFPRAIGIITSLQAAALQDVLAALRRRAPHVPVIIYPSLVQGEPASGQLIEALSAANIHGRCDVLLLVRGGGNIEDLWAFNEESLARAIVASAIPIIAGVGHESDTTISDLVADRRAATPTAAAELATTGWFLAARELIDLNAALHAAIERRLNVLHQRLDDLGRRLQHPATRLLRYRNNLMLLRNRLHNAVSTIHHDRQLALLRLNNRLQLAVPRLESLNHRLDLMRQRMVTLARRQISIRSERLTRLATALTHLNPEATLQRGYAIILNSADGTVISGSNQLARGDTVLLRLAKGSADARIEAVHGPTDCAETPSPIAVVPPQIPD